MQTVVPPTFPTVSPGNLFSLRSTEKITVKFLAPAAFLYAETRQAGCKKLKIKLSSFSILSLNQPADFLSETILLHSEISYTEVGRRINGKRQSQACHKKRSVPNYEDPNDFLQLIFSLLVAKEKKIKHILEKTGQTFF